MSDTQALDALIETIDGAVANAEGGGDALDEILSGPGRTSNVASLKDSDAVNNFRRDLRNGAIRTDTANALLKLIRDLLSKLPLFGGGGA